MPRKKENKKYYLVKSREKNYNYGAFPYSEEGLKEARKYIRKLSDSQEYFIEEK